MLDKKSRQSDLVGDVIEKTLKAKIDGREMKDNLEIRWTRRLKRLKLQYKMIEERYKLRD